MICGVADVSWPALVRRARGALVGVCVGLVASRHHNIFGSLKFIITTKLA